MPSQSLFSGSIATLQKTLNIGSVRHKVLTANIANIDTPNYKEL
jgi:flagellar basal-body rod protein FlgB